MEAFSAAGNINIIKTFITVSIGKGKRTNNQITLILLHDGRRRVRIGKYTGKGILFK
jgi:hypothetical protein